MTALSPRIDNVALRQQEFPLTERWAYLNHGSVGPLPTRTIRALDEINRGFAAPHLWEIDRGATPQCAVREGIGRLAGVAPERVAFVGSTGHGISICAAGIDWRSGDEVVIPHSEYPSLALPFLAQESSGVKVRWAKKNSEGRTDLNAIEAEMSERTRAVAISYVEYADGYRNDLAALAELCRVYDALLIVDTTQAMGAAPLDVDGWGVHAVVAHGYKWLHSGFGIGVAAFSAEGLERIRPTHAGGRSVCTNPYVDEPTLMWDASARRFETGEPPNTLIAGMAASLTLLDEVGPARILPHALSLIDELVDGVREKGYDIASTLDPEHRSQYVAITAGNDVADMRIHVALTEAGVITALRPKGLRVAPTFYNDSTDIQRLIDALPDR
jgi:cysteine desulfurase / selenocysteine lyase